MQACTATSLSDTPPLATFGALQAFLAGRSELDQPSEATVVQDMGQAVRHLLQQHRREYAAAAGAYKEPHVLCICEDQYLASVQVRAMGAVTAGCVQHAGLTKPTLVTSH
jgi:hypothetical protein